MKKNGTTFIRFAMKLNLILFMMLVAFSGTLLAKSSEAQLLENKKVSVTCQNEPLDQCLKKIEQGSGVSFAYDYNQVKNYKVSYFSFKNQKLGKVLSALLSSTDLMLKEQNGVIVIFKSKSIPAAKLFSSIPAGPGTITGVVMDATNKNALPGVTVRVIGSAKATTTDGEGRYTLTLEPGTYTLHFSFIGYESVEMNNINVRADENTTVNAILYLKASKLSEAIVVGYETKQLRNIIGSVASYNPTQEPGQLPLTIDNALVGKMAGVYVTPSSGVPGSATAITIRGLSSLSPNGNSPLIVVDGVPIYGIDRSKNSVDFSAGNTPGFAFGGSATESDYDPSGQQRNSFEANPLSTINPDDIASIQVLKGAFATAIYGSRGAAGVILITTKKGQAGKMRIDAQISTSVSTPFKLPKVMNGNQFADFYTAYFGALDSANAGGWGYPKNYVFPKGINTNWLNEVTRHAIGTNAQLSLSGGSDNGSTYYVSGGYDDEQSYIINNDFKRYQARVNFDQKLTRNFSVGTNVTVSYADNNALNAQSIYRTAVLDAPNQPIKDSLGNYQWGFAPNPIGQISINGNPVATAKENTNYSISTRVLGNVYADLKLTNWLSFRSEFGSDWLNSRSYSRNVDQPTQVGGNGNQTTDQNIRWVINNVFTINHTFGNDHNLTGVVGQSYETSNENTTSIYGSNFPNNTILSIYAASQRGITQALQEKWALLSYFTRINYTYRNKYMAGFTYRLDGSSRFAANHRYVGFPSFALGWVPSEENFLKNVKWIDQLKLRSSLGISGDDGSVGYYGNQGQYQLDVLGATYGNTSIIGVKQPANPNLKWETTYSYDFGADLSLFNSRLTATFDYYTKQIKDAILSSGLPGFMGFTAQIQNLADLSNKGTEITITSANIQRRNFKWSTMLDISHNTNIIKKLHKVDGLDLAEQIEADGGRFWIPGHSASEFFMYQWMGVDTKTGNPLWKDNTGKVISQPISYLNYTNYDAQRLASGDAMPKVFGGIGNTFTYKGFELYGFFSFAYGNKMFNGERSALYNYTASSYFGAQDNNLSPDLLNYWRYAGQKTNIPALLNASNYVQAGFGSTYDFTLAQNITRFMEDASFLKLRTVTLTYSFNKNILHRLKYINSLKIFLEADNVWILTKYSGIDPEVSAYGSNALLSGYDELTMPQPRTFRVGVKIGL